MSCAERVAAQSEKLQSDLHRVEQSAKFSKQSLPHVVAATRVSQDQHWSPATVAGSCQLQEHEHTALILVKTALGQQIKTTV